MKLFIKKECPNCSALGTENITDLEIIEIDNDKYTGLLPGQVPVLQMENGVQIWEGVAINSLFDEIRKRI